MEAETIINVPKLEKIDRKELGEAFAEWAAQQDLEGAGAWVASLDASNQTTLAREIDGFCEDAGFNLAWVIQSQIDNEQLLATLREAVVGYLHANYKASTAQTGLTTYRALVAWLNQPTARKYRQQTRQIYIQLVDSGVIPKASAETLLETDKHRWQHVETVLQQAYQDDPDAVAKAVKSILIDQSAPSLVDRIRRPAASNPEPIPAAS